jgi:hypothetical protein
VFIYKVLQGRIENKSMRKKKKEEEKNAYFTLNIELYPKWILKAM